MLSLRKEFENPAGFQLNYFRVISKGHVEYQFDGLPLLRKINGLTFEPLQPAGFDVEDLKNSKHLKVRNDDVFVLTYPKSGTTWIQNIVYQILHGQESDALYRASPMLEFLGPKYVDGLESPRIIKSHLGLDMLPNLDSARVIFVARNPKDVCVSYYHHYKNLKAYKCKDIQFDDFFELFIDGTASYGDYFEHLKDYLPHLGNSNFYAVLYEELLEDPRKQIAGIAELLGKPLDAPRVAEIAASSNFHRMQKTARKFFRDGAFRDDDKEDHAPVNKHFRNGRSEDWRNYFTQSQSDRIDAKFSQVLEGTVAENWWHEEMKWK